MLTVECLLMLVDRIDPCGEAEQNGQVHVHTCVGMIEVLLQTQG
jgi:hypothetical protein